MFSLSSHWMRISTAPVPLSYTCPITMFSALVPSFFHTQPRGPQYPAGNGSKFVALDGLRGWASLLLFNLHFFLTYTQKSMFSWITTITDVQQLPRTQLLASGHVMIAIFFVISGYVLSYRTLKLLQDRLWEQAFGTLASSAFRRTLRLYAPAVVSAFAVIITIHLCNFVTPSEIAIDPQSHSPAGPEMKTQVQNVLHLFDQWYTGYNPHLWTVAVELQGSMFLFLTLLGTSRLHSKARLVCVTGLTFLCLQSGCWELVLFLSGMLLAECDIQDRIWEDPSSSPFDAPLKSDLEEKLSIQVLARPCCSRLPSTDTASLSPQPYHFHTDQFAYPYNVWFIFFFIGIYVASYPCCIPLDTPGYRFIFLFIPRTYEDQQLFLRSIGAVLIVSSMNHCPSLQLPLTYSIPQYLGRISFPFYIAQGLVLPFLGAYIMPILWEFTEQSFKLDILLASFVAYPLCLATSIWAADLFWRGVELPIIRFARWLENKLDAW
ncbi:hypothetical protein FQN57_007036 [Myotisia sp. PD_48]|nr:hypothetical protein FQN57_007036 [Myotisia sp. PD_48]